MKLNRTNPLLAAALILALAAPAVHAAALTWDTIAGDDTAITPGSGTWNLTAGNAVWNDAGNNLSWDQTSTTVAKHSAIFAGTDSETDPYVVTLASQMAASALTFNNSGYRLTGSIVYLGIAGTPNANGAITVAPGKTATINSVLGYVHNTQAMVTVGSEGVLNLGGGTQGSNRPQLTLAGDGTVNITAGTFQSTIGSRNAAIINHTGGTWTMTDQSPNVTTSIGSGAGRNVNYTLSGTGIMNALTSNDTAASYTLSLGRNMGNFKSTLTLQNGGTLNVGVTAKRAGQINLGSFDGNGHSLLDVQGGTLTVGTGQPSNKICFFAAGATAGKTATLMQSGGTITANGIQFGANTGDTVGGTNGANPYAADALATLRLSGGNLYVGTFGITRGTAATDLPIAIQLQGGTLGASQSWGSNMDMKLTAATIRTADSGGVARNITLSGTLSDDEGVNGTLTKTGSGTLTLSGANTYTGGTTVNAGTLLLGGTSNLPTTGTLQVNAGGNFSLADGTARTTTAAALGLASGALLSFDWNEGSVDTLVSTTAATTTGVIGLSINNLSPSGSGGTLISSPGGGLTTANGTQYFLVNNTNYTAALTVTDTAVSIGAQIPATELLDAYWLGGQIGEAPAAMNLSNGTTTNWATNAAGASTAGLVPGGSLANIIFGSAGATQQANVSTFTDLNLASITFNDTESVTLSGSYTLSLNSPSDLPAATSGAATAVVPGCAITVTPFANALNTINTGIQLANNQTWSIAAGKTLAVGGPIGGASSLTKADAGTLALSGSNTYSGSTNIDAGTLQLSGAGKLGNGSYAGAITLGDGATFENAAATSQTLSGTITGAGGTLKQTTDGQLILTNAANSYGALIVASGRAIISSNAAALPAAATVSILGGILNLNLGASYGNAITVSSGGGIATRNAAGTSLTGAVTLPSSGIVIFNNDDSTTYNLTIASDQTLSGNLTVQIGGSRTNANPVGGATLSGKLSGNGSLTVASSGQVTSPHFGTGVLTLSGPNDYSGDTTVSVGTLRLSNAPDPANANPGNDASTVTIAETRATLDLTFTGTDNVAKLFIGETQMAAGVYGKSGSLAPIIGIPQITGNGTLTVATGPAGYASWITGTFANGTVPLNQQGPNDDPDNDGIRNLVEYAIAGQDPTVPNPSIGTFTTNTLSFAKRIGAAGLTYAIQESTDLGISDDWSDVPTGGSYVNDDTTISYTLTPGSPERNFIRLKVSQ